ncbi:MAG: large conductance mechanosensitive channel protein MscL [Candidatus Ancillula sp.]|nr:large conductance mechanosensitive channel protein MscL [Candidatus Ancillula sp.]
MKSSKVNLSNISAESINQTVRTTAKKTAGIFKGFRDFALRGNAIELAVGVVIGAALTALVKVITSAVIQPIINAVVNWNSDYLFEKNVIAGNISLLVGGLVTFIITMAAVYFCIVLPLNKLMEVTQRQKEEEKAASKEIAANHEEELLMEIRDLLKAAQPKKIINSPKK